MSDIATVGDARTALMAYIKSGVGGGPMRRLAAFEEAVRAEERAPRASLRDVVDALEELVREFFKDGAVSIDAANRGEQVLRALAGASTPAEREEQG